MPAARRPAPPAHLGPRARAAWSNITRDYDLRSDELEILKEAVRTIDTLDRLDNAARGAPPLIEGSHGGMVAHPALVEGRQHRLVLGRLIRQLGCDEAELAGAPVPLHSSRRSHRTPGVA